VAPTSPDVLERTLSQSKISQSTLTSPTKAYHPPLSHQKSFLHDEDDDEIPPPPPEEKEEIPPPPPEENSPSKDSKLITLDKEAILAEIEREITKQQTGL